MIGNKFATRILVSSNVSAPVCFGIFRPVIVLPQTMLADSTPQQLEMILNHELAHIRRGDCWINLLQRIIEAVFFFHPLIWYASYRITQEREQICDNYVIAQGAPPTDYVELLSHIVEPGRRSRYFQAVALFEGRLLARVQSMLDPAHNSQTKLPLAARIACLTAILTCGVLTTIHLEAKSPAAGRTYKQLPVTVLDADGKPVSGAAIEALANYKPAAQAHTDSSGRATLNIPDGSPVTWIIALKDGAGFDYYENYEHTPFTPRPELPDHVTLTLDGARTIRMQAVDSAGKTLPNVPFVLWTFNKWDKKTHVNLSGSRIARRLTDDKGNVQVDWFPADRLSASFLFGGNDYFGPEYIIGLNRVSDTKQKVRLLRITTVSGKVLLPDGRPAANAAVRAEGRGNTPYFCRRTTRTAADGSYSLKLYPNQIYMLTAEGPEHASKTQSNVILRENQPIENMDFRLVAGTVVSGRVISQADDKPMANQLVFLCENGPKLPSEFRDEKGFGNYSNKQALIKTTRTNEQGQYSFRTGPGDYTLGTLSMIAHADDKKPAENFTIKSQKGIAMDLATTRPDTGSKAIGIAFANQDEVYNATMVANSCHYCHLPRPASLSNQK